ncbi:alkaline phosphatase family protein [Deinococcus sp.]|uniref:alkaline phosphatase family protein n=1 Tax=Deinococcus sp. TaxID=47478 RepID=UPI003CC6DB5B
MPRLPVLLTPLLLTSALAAPAPKLQHVFVFVLENHSLSTVLGNPNLPTLNRLATTYGYAANYTGVTHPSLPNYVAMIAGDTMGTAGDDPGQRFAGDNLALQLEKAGLSWRGYMQGLPTTASTADYAGAYGKKHNPFMLSSDIVNSPQRVQNVVPYEQFGADLSSGSVPNFAFLVPDVCHDMHGALNCLGRAALDRAGDTFIGTWTQKIMASPIWKSGAAIVITFDEGGGGDKVGGGGRVATIVLTPDGPRGKVSRVPYNHSSLLRTIQEGFGLPLLRGAKTATAMNDLFWK